jgi:hypothetical protein
VEELRDMHRGKPNDHCVVFYGDDHALLSYHVAEFFAEGLSAGEVVLSIATPMHNKLFRRGLIARGIDVARAAHDERLVFLDAHATLDAISLNGDPELSRFREVLGKTIERLAARANVRAYGEMVGLLWRDRSERQAVALEQLWSDFQEIVPFTLLCAYPIDIFDDDFTVQRIHRIMRSHTALVSAHPALKTAVDGGLDRVLGPQAHEARFVMNTEPEKSDWGSLPDAEATILWLRRVLPRHSNEIMQHVREHFFSGEPVV